MKKKILWLVVIMVTILWLAVWVNHVTAYNHMIEKTREQWGNELVDKIVDFRPIYSWRSGELIVMMGIFISIAWIVNIFKSVMELKKRRNGHSKIMPLIVCGMIVMLIVTTLNLSFAVAEPTHEEEHVFCAPNSVDLLFVCDEELRAKKEYVKIKENGKYEIWYSTRKIEEKVFPHLQKRFLEQVGISIAFNGWINWSSNNDEHDPIFLVIEAMEETGWVAEQTYRERSLDAHGLTWTDKHRRMDILVVLTLQSMDYDGQAINKWAAEELSKALGKTVYWDACIVSYKVGDVDRSCQFIQHEVSHLFGLSHCPNLLCVMNTEGIHHVEVQWCGSCKEELRAWADIVPSEQYPPC